MRTPMALFGLALAVRAVLVALYPDPAYPDSYYYVDVARSIAAGHGLNVDFVWIFAEVGNRIPSPAVLPIPSNAHWLPLSSFVQVPFIVLLGPTALASALPMVLIGATAAPLTWFIARDAGARPIVAVAAGVLSAIPGAATVFMAQPENFAILQPLVAATLWSTARGLKGDGRAFAAAGLLAGVASLSRNDGVLLAGAVAIVWLADRLRWWRGRRGRGAWTHVDDRPPISILAGVGALILFGLVMGPWWARQLIVFGSLSPTSANGAALWIRDIREWNSVTAHPTLATFLAQGPGAILASRIQGLAASLTIFTVVICSVVLTPFLLLGGVARRTSRDFQPWFLYTFVVFAGAALLFPLHVPGGTFLHSAIGLAPHAAILSVEGIVLAVGWLARLRRGWDASLASRVLVWGIVGIVVATGAVFGRPVQQQWDDTRQARIALAGALDRLAAPADDRILSIDAAGMKYWTGHPGVVTPDDPIDTIEAVARAYGTRWLVVERRDAVRALAPVLAGQRPSWIGPPAFTVPASDGGLPGLALFPICLAPQDLRCAGS